MRSFFAELIGSGGESASARAAGPGGGHGAAPDADPPRLELVEQDAGIEASPSGTEGQEFPFGKKSRKLWRNNSFDSTPSTRSAASGRRPEIWSQQEILADVRTELETTHDILAAEALLRGLAERLVPEEWDELQETELLENFRQEIERFYDIGKACCLETEGWFTAWQDPASDAHVECELTNEGGKQALRYRAHVPLAAGLPAAFAVSNELDLFPRWNPVIASAPEVRGDRTACHLAAVTYQVAFAAGLYRLDFQQEVQRYIDPEAGFVAESASPVPAEHRAYQKPQTGHSRPEGESQRVWLAIGRSACILVQAGSVRLPFHVNARVAKMLVSWVARRLVLALQAAAGRASQPGSHWEAAMKSDPEGLYTRLSRVADSEGSRQRAAEVGSLGGRSKDLARLFGRHGLLRGRPLSTPRGAKKVSFGPSLSLRSIPNRDGLKTEYAFLAEQHERLKKAVEAYTGGDDSKEWAEKSDSRLARSRVESGPADAAIGSQGSDAKPEGKQPQRKRRSP